MTGRLSMLAGHGELVREGADAALAKGWQVQIVDLVGRDDAANYTTTPASVTKPLSIWMALRKFKPTHICMIGAVKISDRDREGLSGFIRGKNRGAKAKASGSGGGGDSAMSQLGKLLEFATGAKVVGIHEIVEDLLAPGGMIAGPKLNKKNTAQAAQSMQWARAVGQLDAGQVIVTAGTRIIAIEDIAGTDALMARVGEYRRQGMTGDGSAPLMLTKCRKPGQSGNIDMPAIGPDTVENAARAGIATIVVQSQQTLLISRGIFAQRAMELGVSVIGIEADDTNDG